METVWGKRKWSQKVQKKRKKSSQKTHTHIDLDFVEKFISFLEFILHKITANTTAGTWNILLNCSLYLEINILTLRISWTDI